MKSDHCNRNYNKRPPLYLKHLHNNSMGKYQTKILIRNSYTRESPVLDGIFFFLGLSQFKGRRAGSVFNIWLQILCKNKIASCDINFWLLTYPNQCLQFFTDTLKYNNKQFKVKFIEMYKMNFNRFSRNYIYPRLL